MAPDELSLIPVASFIPLHPRDGVQPTKPLALALAILSICQLFTVTAPVNFTDFSEHMTASFLDVEYSKDLLYPDGTFTSKYGSGFYLVIEDAETDYAIAMSMYFYITAPGATTSRTSSSSSSPPLESASSATTKSTTTPPPEAYTSSESAQSSISSITVSASASASTDTPSTRSTFDALEPSTPSSSSAAATSSADPQSKNTDTASPSSHTTSIIAASIGGVCAAVVIFGIAIYLGIRRHRRCRRGRRHRRRSHYDANNPLDNNKNDDDDTNAQVTEIDGNCRTNYSVLPTYSPSEDVKARSSPSSSAYNDDARPGDAAGAVELPVRHHDSAELPG
ncbi:hypothetical protein LTS17_011787 [Exophiala oligosperma]